MKNADPAQMQRGLRIHVFVFVAGMFMMGIINLWTGPPYWVGWILLGWGAGVLAHWLAVRGHLSRGGGA